MPVAGKGERKILVVGYGPSQEEDQSGRLFSDQYGRFLWSVMNRLGVDLQRDCWLTGAWICHGKKPPPKVVEHCRPNVVKAITELRPETIILLGKEAVESVVGWLWKPDVGPLERWIGWRMPVQKINAWVCPAWSPAHMVWSMKEKSFPVMEMMFTRHLRAAVEGQGRPWKKVPDWRSKVRAIIDHGDAADVIREMTATGRPLSFDFESDTLKPDRKGAELVCCSVSDGRTAIAYPWHGEAIKATREMIRSDNPKIGFNLKHEERWCRAKLGCGIRNQKFDGMLAAHVLDNRPSICSLEFQEFAVLGFADHKDGIKPYFKSKGSNEKNKIREISLPRLLEYCGTDSLIEWKLAVRQAKLLGIELC